MPLKLMPTNCQQALADSFHKEHGNDCCAYARLSMPSSAPDAGTAVTAVTKHLGVLRLAGRLHQHCRDGITVLSCQMLPGA